MLIGSSARVVVSASLLLGCWSSAQLVGSASLLLDGFAGLDRLFGSSARVVGSVRLCFSARRFARLPVRLFCLSRRLMMKIGSASKA